jgi:hypothetical protein
MTRYLAASLLAIVAAAAMTLSQRPVDLDTDLGAASFLSLSGELPAQVRNRTSLR